MHVFGDGNSGSWREWGKTGRRRRFGYFGGGELETPEVDECDSPRSVT
jgi:hypothetical protein